MIAYNKSKDIIEHVPAFLLGISEAERKAYGFYPVFYGGTPDPLYYSSEPSRFFNQVLEQYEITYNAIPRDLSIVKAELVSKVKAIQSKLLTEIDWYWLRELKTGIAVPADIISYSQNIYSVAQQKESDILALADIDACINFCHEQGTSQYIDPVTGESLTGTTFTNNLQVGWPVKP